MHLFCFGLGYSALAVARHHGAAFSRISGTVRTAQKAAALAGAGVEPLLHAGGEPGPALREALASADAVLVSAAPDEAGDPLLRLLASMAELPRAWPVVYLSTIGVYGDHGGAWIDETAPLNAGNPRGRRRIEAEAAWLARGERLGSPVQVLRLAGIYGPGRSAVDDLRAGVARRLIKPGQVFNRIHVDDIAAAVMAALAHPEATGAFNICDDEPAPPQDVVEYAARRLGLPVPPDLSFEQAQLSEMARSFYAECKRCRNHRARRALGWRPQYPSYREGLDAIIAAP